MGAGIFSDLILRSAAVGRVSKDGGKLSALRPSFETLAALAPQDEDCRRDRHDLRRHQHLAILIAAIAGWLAGAVWYMALGKQWVAAQGSTMEAFKARRPR